MRPRSWIIAALGLALSASGCLRLMDEPPEAGALGAECHDSSECAPGSSCLGTNTSIYGTGTCGAVGVCENDFQCGDLKTCNSGKCEAVECDYNHDEPCAPYYCDSSSNVCKHSCESDGNCTGDYVCRSGLCVADKCTVANAAVLCLGYACDTVLGECRNNNSSCTTVGCATGYLCDGGYDCKKTCSVTGPTTQCGNYRCEPPSQFSPDDPAFCLASCSEHTDCLNGTVCVAGRCGPKP
jgi:hypothetical protein